MTESEIRLSVVKVAKNYLGVSEGSIRHKEIIDTYNAYTDPNRRNYKMTTKDAWCMTFVSFCFIKAGQADLIVTECGCGEAVRKNASIKKNWVESDGYIPKAGDIIMYDWQDSGSGDDIGWPDHTGIVESCDGATIHIIEGNNTDMVKRTSYSVNAKFIRGFIAPDYSSKATEGETQSAFNYQGDFDYQTTAQLRIRKNPVDGATLISMPSGTKVKSLSNPWVKVRYEKDGKIYEGWSSLKHLKTI